ncbi:hypothetical protein [Gordonia malaquae]|uniref:hypothetical protein n=1 Tax=Gordonia malaquae TaxID=410332 RepID=UPI0030FE8D9A
MFSRAQMGRLGFTDATLRTAIRQGRVRRLRQGWFAFDDADPTVASAVKAGGVLGCVSALTLSGLWVPPGYSRVHVRRSKALRGAGSRAGCTTPVGRAPATLTAVDPVEYALACAASCMTAEDWIAVCDSYLNSTGTSVDDLRFRIEPFTGYRLAGLLEKVDERSQSGSESIMRVRLRAIGFDVVVQPGIAEYEWTGGCRCAPSTTTSSLAGRTHSPTSAASRTTTDTVSGTFAPAVWSTDLFGAMNYD